MDVKRNIVGPVSITGKSEDERTWMLAAGSCGSAAEHSVFEKLHGIESVSTEKILGLANRQGIPIYTINQDNISVILPLISAPANVKQNISDSVVNSGWIAVIPQRGLQVNQWFGYGWQIIDPNSGAAGYLLAGYLTSGSILTTAGGMGSILHWLLEVHHLHAVLAGIGLIGALLALTARGYSVFGPYAAGVAAALLASGYAPIVFWIGVAMVLIAIVAAALLMAYSNNYNYIRRRWYAFSNKVVIIS